MKKNTIKAWAIINGTNGFIYHHDFRRMLSIYADEEEASNFAEPSEDEQVVSVEIRILPSKPLKTKPKKK